MERVKMAVNHLLLVVIVALSIGLYSVITTRQASAQYWNPPSSFPRQSELWSFSADGANTFIEPGPGQAPPGHMFVVQADINGRLPVLTTIHAAWAVDSVDGGGLYREIGGRWKRWEATDHNGPQYQTRFHNSTIGVVLKPGKYLVTGQNSEDYFLLVSGYWARK